jgi:hypothetical protein
VKDSTRKEGEIEDKELTFEDVSETLKSRDSDLVETLEAISAGEYRDIHILYMSYYMVVLKYTNRNPDRILIHDIGFHITCYEVDTARSWCRNLNTFRIFGV